MQSQPAVPVPAPAPAPAPACRARPAFMPRPSRRPRPRPQAPPTQLSGQRPRARPPSLNAPPRPALLRLHKLPCAWPPFVPPPAPIGQGVSLLAGTRRCHWPAGPPIAPGSGPAPLPATPRALACRSLARACRPGVRPAFRSPSLRLRAARAPSAGIGGAAAGAGVGARGRVHGPGTGGRRRRRRRGRAAGAARSVRRRPACAAGGGGRGCGGARPEPVPGHVGGQGEPVQEIPGQHLQQEQVSELLQAPRVASAQRRGPDAGERAARAGRTKRRPRDGAAPSARRPVTHAFRRLEAPGRAREQSAGPHSAARLRALSHRRPPGGGGLGPGLALGRDPGLPAGERLARPPRPQGRRSRPRLRPSSLGGFARFGGGNPPTARRRTVPRAPGAGPGPGRPFRSWALRLRAATPAFPAGPPPPTGLSPASPQPPSPQPPRAFPGPPARGREPFPVPAQLTSSWALLPPTRCFGADRPGRFSCCEVFTRPAESVAGQG